MDVRIYESDGTLKWINSGNSAASYVNKLVWSPDFTALAFAEDALGIITYNLTTGIKNTLTYPHPVTSWFNGLDWSPHST